MLVHDKVYWEIETSKSIFKRNNYPRNFINHCIKEFYNKLFVQKDLNFIVPKRVVPLEFYPI